MALSTAAYAAQSATDPLTPWTFDRKEPEANEVLIDIAYCGVCHSDLHFVRNEWGFSVYPMVPGHEIVGHVKQVGSEVTRYQVGDRVGVGCMVDSCRTCESCQAGEEQYCEKGSTFTYNGQLPDGSITYGGYSTQITVNQDFVVRVPENLPLDAAAPLLCAGITTYSPLRHFGVKPGMKVAVLGLGGLGHMGVKFAKAMGAEVTVLSQSERKRADALAMGADHYLAMNVEGVFEENAARFDFLLDTVSAPHDYNAYLGMLRRDGRMVLVGVPPEPTPVAAFPLIVGRRSISGSLIGGIRETQEMLDFCGEHGIVCEIELIQMAQINEAYERMLKSDVRYRFVIDLASLKG
jgi:uncharacterized zinc-type alcohol dehydrogenase-like protein